VVFLSIYEHNSNLLAWRDSGAMIEIVPIDNEGDFDYEALQKILEKYKNYNSLKVGTFSAGSNITGNLFDCDRIAILCH
jgi:selenocysteine lyase/cysteine desulfurase